MMVITMVATDSILCTCRISEETPVDGVSVNVSSPSPQTDVQDITGDVLEETEAGDKDRVSVNVSSLSPETSLLDPEGDVMEETEGDDTSLCLCLSPDSSPLEGNPLQSDPQDKQYSNGTLPWEKDVDRTRKTKIDVESIGSDMSPVHHMNLPAHLDIPLFVSDKEVLAGRGVGATADIQQKPSTHAKKEGPTEQVTAESDRMTSTVETLNQEKPPVSPNTMMSMMLQMMSYYKS